MFRRDQRHQQIANEESGEKGDRGQSEIDQVRDPRDQPPLLLKHELFRLECTSKRCLCDIRKSLPDRLAGELGKEPFVGVGDLLPSISTASALFSSPPPLRLLVRAGEAFAKHARKILEGSEVKITHGIPSHFPIL